MTLGKSNAVTDGEKLPLPMPCAVAVSFQKKSAKHRAIDNMKKISDKESDVQNRGLVMVFLVETRYCRTREGDENVRGASVGGEATWTCEEVR